MNNGLFVELSREVWAMEPRALEGFLLRVGAISEHVDMIQIRDMAGATHVNTDSAEPAAWMFDEEQPKKSRMTVQGGVASIPISGVLMKSVPKIFRYFGIEATAYRDIQNDLALALGDESVKSISLVVDSPGGQVAGVKEASDAIAAAGQLKPVSAHISDLGASGAYWLASQAKKVTASRNAVVGSIGVYSTYVDSSKAAENEGFKVHVISSGPHKGMGVPGAPITSEQLGAMQEVINGMAASFVSDVSRGRARGEAVVKEWATGRVWIASDAAALGLVDGISSSMDRTRAGVPPAALINPRKEEEETMEGTTKPAAGVDTQAVSEKAANDARTAERQRLADLKAAFPKDQAFAFEQYEAGATVDQAKVAYCSVLEAREAKAQQELADLKKAQPAKLETKPVGARPLPSGEEAAESTSSSDFLSRARQLAKEKGCTVRQALSEIARTEPAVYERHMQSIGAGAILERRRQIDAERSERGRSR